MVHVVHGGRTHDLSFEQLFPAERFANIGIPEGTVLSASALNAGQVKTALAQYFDTGITEFNDHFVDFNTKGNTVTVRPNATFG